MRGFIFDLDQTIVDSSLSEEFRRLRNWSAVYELIPSFKIYDGMHSLLNEIIRNKYQICIVTNSPESYCKKVIKQFDLPVNFTVCYHDTTRKKPFPDPMLLALKKLELAPSNVISVGDRDIDIISSKTAKIYTIGVTWGCDEIEKVKLIDSRPNLLFECVSDFTEHLRAKGTLSDFNAS